MHVSACPMASPPSPDKFRMKLVKAFRKDSIRAYSLCRSENNIFSPSHILLSQPHLQASTSYILRLLYSVSNNVSNDFTPPQAWCFGFCNSVCSHFERVSTQIIINQYMLIQNIEINPLKPQDLAPSSSHSTRATILWTS